MKRVFVSSTYIDLQEHREKVLSVIRRLESNEIAMENFGARSDHPKEGSIKAVKESDIYIGIFGHRYGTIPEGDDISLTEAEYRAAVSLNLPRLIFLIDKSYEIDNNQKEDEIKKNKLVKLKKELKKELMIDTFSSPDDLASKVATSLFRQLNELKKLDKTNEDFDISKLFESFPYAIAREVSIAHEEGYIVNFKQRVFIKDTELSSDISLFSKNNVFHIRIYDNDKFGKLSLQDSFISALVRLTKKDLKKNNSEIIVLTSLSEEKKIVKNLPIEAYCFNSQHDMEKLRNRIYQGLK